MDVVRAQLSGARRGAMAGVAMLATLACGAGCGTEGEGSVPVAQARAPARGEGGALVSLDSALTLFRVGLPPVERLETAAASRDELIDQLLHALSRSDTSALRAMVMSRREFAYLFYPSSRFTSAPTKQEPALAWFLHLQASQKGVTRLLNRYGGTALSLVDHQCGAPVRMGSNTLWWDCAQRIAHGGDTVTTRLIGGILERDRRFKVFSYGNDL